MLPIGVPRILDPQVSTQQHHRILCRCYPVVPRSLGGGLKYFVEFQPYLGKNKNILTFIFFSDGLVKNFNQVLQKPPEKKTLPRFSWIFGRFERTLAAATNFPRSAETTCHHGELCTVERGQLGLGGWDDGTPRSKVEKKTKNPKREKSHDETNGLFKEGGPTTPVFFGDLGFVRFFSFIWKFPVPNREIWRTCHTRPLCRE